MKFSLFKVLLVLFAAVIVCTSGSYAQNERPLKAVKFRLMSWASPIAGLNFESSGKVQPIDEVLPHTRTAAYSFIGNGDLNLFRVSQDASGNQVREVLATLPYSELENNMLLLVNETSKPYKVRKLPESGSKFPPGSFRLMSFTNLPVKVGIGSEVDDLPPYGDLIVKPKLLKAGDVFPLRIVATGEKGLELVYSNRWLYGDKERVMLFVDRGSAQENRGLIVKCFTEDYNPDHDKPPVIPKAKEPQ